MTKEEVKFGDIIHASDDSIVKVHHIGENGQVHYIAYADFARGQMQGEPFNRYYGYINKCYPATEKQKQFLEKWIEDEKK